MKSLAAVQQEFKDYVLHHDPRIESEVIGTPKADARTRLSIYANAYRLRLIEVLESHYEVLHTLLGDMEFDKLGHLYLEHYPSKHPNIRWFGQHLYRVLRENPPYNAHPALEEMATFEWALQCAFDAGDTPPLTIDAMAAVPFEAWSDMRLIPQPSLQRLNFEWNTVALWRAIDAQKTPPKPRKRDLSQGWVVWRKDLRPQFRSLEVDEAWAIDSVLDGQSFGVICEGLCEWIDAQHVGLHAATLLKGWVSEGMIATLRTS
jgi:hypothetical protein